MNLTAYFAFFLFLLSKFISCSKLPQELQDSIASIKNEHRLDGAAYLPIPTFENDQEIIDFLSTMDKEGVLKVAKEFVQAYKDVREEAIKSNDHSKRKLFWSYLEKLRHAMIVIRNAPAFEVIFEVAGSPTVPLLWEAIAHDSGEIFCRLYREGSIDGRTSEKIVDVVRNNSTDIMKWMITEGYSYRSVVNAALLACIERNNNEMIDLIFSVDSHLGMGGFLKTYPEVLKEGYMRGYEKVFIKAAECGNMRVVQFYFDIGAMKKGQRKHMEVALEKAIENEHHEIAELIRGKLEDQIISV